MCLELVSQSRGSLERRVVERRRFDRTPPNADRFLRTLTQNCLIDQVQEVATGLLVCWVMRPLLALVMMVVGCGTGVHVPVELDAGVIRQEGQSGDALTATAIVENGLPYDGCSYPITIADKTFAPSPASVGLVEGAIATKVGKRSVTLTYRITGSMGTVPCGWNSKQTFPEIEVVSIQP